MKIHIRQYEPGDLKNVHQLMHELGYPMDEDDLKFNIDLIQQRNGRIIVAEVNGITVGCISILINAGLAEGLFGEIISLIVLKDFRGMGIGKKLVLNAENWLKPKVKKTRIRANSIRIDAHKFFKSLGYQDIKTQITFMKTI